MTREERPLRASSQHLLPVRKPEIDDGYDVYPVHPLDGPIRHGYDALAEWMAGRSTVLMDGFGGVFWQEVTSELDRHLKARGVAVSWVDVSVAQRPVERIEALVSDYVGHDPVFGKRYPGRLADFFDEGALAKLHGPTGADLTVVYGCGAALVGWDAPLVYLDVPKNEVQYRSRAGSVTNLGAPADGAKAMYQRFYFVDWPVLNRHKRELLPDIALFVDSQRPGEPLFASGDDLRAGIDAIAHSHFRVRPWFEPGAWGGQWIRQRIAGLNDDVPNYAWSFELITPENGLIFESGGAMLEASFDLLMYQEAEAVLGYAHERFGEEFPIRFDFLDTVDGGNLSVQCHPRPDYIREHFGENFTQDETYYILDREPGARVYLGFREGVEPEALRAELERSQREGVAIDIDAYVSSRESRKHDLYLIPHGTVHSAGKGNLVLEISATPYIFTFKMYDWMRLDLDGRPRPINIERAFDNLDFGRAGERIERELVSEPTRLDEGDDWRLEALPTHPDHFYDVRRYRFQRDVTVEDDGGCHVMSLVEGDAVRVTWPDGSFGRYRYAETFVIPAAAGAYTLVNDGPGEAVVVQALVRRTG